MTMCRAVTRSSLAAPCVQLRTNFPILNKDCRADAPAAKIGMLNRRCIPEGAFNEK